MRRERLISEVKEEYARLAMMQNRDSFIDNDSEIPEAFFERLLGNVISGIEDGRFDRFMNGRQIMEAVANSPSRWGIPLQ
jgi:hypothetical protein